MPKHDAAANGGRGSHGRGDHQHGHDHRDGHVHNRDQDAGRDPARVRGHDGRDGHDGKHPSKDDHARQAGDGGEAKVEGADGETAAVGEKAGAMEGGAAAGAAGGGAKHSAAKTSGPVPTVPAASSLLRRGPGLPRTLSFDIGGTGLKASVLSKHGDLLHVPVRVATPYPLRPDQLVSVLEGLTPGLPTFQRVSAGFPGMVRAGHVLSAPHFVSPSGPGGEPTADLERAWDRFDLQGALAAALGKPCRVANDADVQGAALVKGEGLELVITLGTGVGTALFWRGKLAPHLELAHHPLGAKGQNYNEILGEEAREKVGNKEWNARLADTITVLRQLVFFDHCYIGGGNSRRVKIDLPADVSLADNTAGILGGIKLWERS